ncbi:MAG: PilZ domain-containing protein [Candidatus Anammoxibacter sp.]
MKIVSRQSSNAKIEIIELVGGLNGGEAIELRDWLFDHLDKNICKDDAIIDLKRVSRIDGLGIAVLEHFMSRGIDIRLLNVGTGIRLMLNIAEKKELLKKIYNETDCDKSVSIFEKEIVEEVKTIETGIKKRHYYRANTSFPVSFKYNLDDNRAILCNANVVNLSEHGLFANAIKAVDMKDSRIVSAQEVVGSEYHNIKFELRNGRSKHIETEGEYVWQNDTNGNIGVGMRFKDMNQNYRDIIKDYIYNIIA